MGIEAIAAMSSVQCRPTMKNVLNVDVKKNVCTHVSASDALQKKCINKAVGDI